MFFCFILGKRMDVPEEKRGGRGIRKRKEKRTVKRKKRDKKKKK